ncbi:MAG: lytic transglycosylase domain-containing protein [Candidatus Gastranaerophilaceae bacterium]
MIRKLVVFTMTIVFLLCPQVKANQHSVSNVKESIVKHSLELGIDPALALSIAKSESGFRHEARSSHGAVGVFQLMPSTARRLGVDPYCLSGNIKGGLMYYKRLYNMFGSTELALAAYNAGPGIVKKYHRVPPYGETRQFVSTIMKEYNRQKANPDPAIVKARNKTKLVKQAHTQKITPEKLEVKAPVPEAIPEQGIV